MPELPETETIARDLDRLVSGSLIGSVRVLRADVLKRVTARGIAARLAGQRVDRVWRRAKNVVIDLSKGDRILIQPRFTGVVSVLEQGDCDPLPYECLRLVLSGGRAAAYCDVRRLGTVTVATPEQFRDINSALGIEPLDPAFTSDRLSGLLRGSQKLIKALLMDQSRIAGCGNIYASEALWRAGVDPSRRASTLTPSEAAVLRGALVSVLEESIAARGTTFRDYRDALGERGRFSEQLAAYGRGGEPCRRCGRRLVLTHAIDGRSTYFCYNCQS